MKKNKKSIIPEHFASAEEAGQFWDTHDLTDFLEHTKSVDMGFDIRRRHYYISVSPVLLKKMKQVSDKEGQSLKAMANQWLQEKLLEKMKRSCKQVMTG